jgi:hypothetical protein
MAASSSVNLLYSAGDGDEWATYVVDVLARIRLKVARIEMDASGKLIREGIPLDGATTETADRRYHQTSDTVLMVMCTPKLLGTLLKNPSIRLDDLMPSSPSAERESPNPAADATAPSTATDGGEPALLFMCGTFRKDLDELDSDQRQISDRFPRLEHWTVVEHEKALTLPTKVLRLVEQIEKKRRHRRAVKPLPVTLHQRSPISKLQFTMVPTEASCGV